MNEWTDGYCTPAWRAWETQLTDPIRYWPGQVWMFDGDAVVYDRADPQHSEWAYVTKTIRLPSSWGGTYPALIAMHVPLAALETPTARH